MPGVPWYSGPKKHSPSNLNPSLKLHTIQMNLVRKGGSVKHKENEHALLYYVVQAWHGRHRMCA